MDRVKGVEKPQHAKPHATFVARICWSKNNREEYVKAIDEVIGVFAPSDCFHNMEWTQCGERPCSKVEMIRDYKIYLAFENGDSPGYITEKIYHAMEAGVLPVYMGTSDVADAVPKGSYIDVAEFNTPHDVANYLKVVLENETLYNSYFEWKHKLFDPEFEVPNRVLWEVNHYCRVCYYVDALQRGVKWDHLYQRAEDRIPKTMKATDEKTSKTEIAASDMPNLVNTLKRNLPNYEANNTFDQALFWSVLTVLICLLFIKCMKVLKKFSCGKAL